MFECFKRGAEIYHTVAPPLTLSIQRIHFQVTVFAPAAMYCRNMSPRFLKMRRVNNSFMR